MQKLGQHFLKNKSALRLMVDALDLKPDETAIEIGPGHGELTDIVRDRGQGTWIRAIEKDRILAERLKEKFKNDSRIEIIPGDILEILDPFLSTPNRAPFKLVGNIPYYITGHLLRIISEFENKPARCVFTIQKEVAERIIATPPHMNRLAASVQFWAEPKILKVLPAADFNPPPKVESAIIRLETRERGRGSGDEGAGTRDRGRYYAAVRTLFAQPRKTILNNLRAGDGKESGEEKVFKLQKLGIDPGARPQDLAIENIIAIANALF